MELLTVHETAQLLKVSPITVRRFIMDGRLPAVRVGKSVRVNREAIDALLAPVRPRGSPPRKPSTSRAGSRRFTRDDALWSIVGIADGPDGPTDVSENKYKYLAETYEPTHE